MTMSKSSEGKEQKNRQEEINAKRKARKEKKKLRIRKFPISLRILVVIIIFCISLLLGIMFGYSILGDCNALDALNHLHGSTLSISLKKNNKSFCIYVKKCLQLNKGGISCWTCSKLKTLYRIAIHFYLLIK